MVKNHVKRVNQKNNNIIIIIILLFIIQHGSFLRVSLKWLFRSRF